jgi:hypothetical protein
MELIGTKREFSRRSALLLGIAGVVAMVGGNLRAARAATQTLGQDKVNVNYGDKRATR